MCMNFAATTDAMKDCHCGYETFNPWYWIEPTGIISRSDYVVCPLASIGSAGIADYKTKGISTKLTAEEGYYYPKSYAYFQYKFECKPGSLIQDHILWLLSILDAQTPDKHVRFCGGSYTGLVLVGGKAESSNWDTGRTGLSDAI